jgi:sugar/nucleoside kinase (ribokinase family)
MEELNVVVAGHLCLDIIPDMQHVPDGKLTSLLQPGHLLITGPATFSSGGPVSNTGLALHRLGISTRLIAKVGADPLGMILRGIVNGFGPDLASGLVEDSISPTSYSIILSAPGVDRIFMHCPGANDTFGAEDVNFDLVSQARLFHFGYPPVMRRMYSAEGRELVALFRRVKECGATSTLDMTFPDPAADGGKADWRRILTSLLPSVDVFLPSFDELMFMLHREEYEEACRVSACGDLAEAITPQRLSALGSELLGMGVKIAVIKLGERGLYLRTAGGADLAKMGRGSPPNLAAWSQRELWSACYAVQVVGTTGSGDATIAGFLSALLRGFEPEEAIGAAVAVGACNVEAADALSGLRTWEETLARMAAGWPHRPMHLAEPGWMEMRPGLWEHNLGGKHAKNLG